jgi:hypothetical protein
LKCAIFKYFNAVNYGYFFESHDDFLYCPRIHLGFDLNLKTSRLMPNALSSNEGKAESSQEVRISESSLSESRAGIGGKDGEGETEETDFSFGRGSSPKQHTLGSHCPLSCEVGAPTCAQETRN